MRESDIVSPGGPRRIDLRARWLSAGLFSVCSLLAAPAPSQAQGGAVGLTVGSAHGVQDGGVTAGFTEARWEPRRAAFSPLLIAGFRVGGNSCEDSDPAGCALPSTTALVLRAGAAVARRVGPAEVVVAPTVGALRWGGAWDPSVRVDAGLRFGIGQGVQLQGGGQFDFVWTGRTTGSVRVRERRVDFVGAQLGVRFETGGRRGRSARAP